jgi:hypothetical protein
MSYLHPGDPNREWRRRQWPQNNPNNDKAYRDTSGVTKSFKPSTLRKKCTACITSAA